MPLAFPEFDRRGALEYPFPVAVKTRTSSRFRDAWAVAYSKRWIVGAWVGEPDFRPMNRLTGYRSAAALVQKVLLALHPDEADGLEDVPFPPPRDARLVRICPMTGMRASEACDRVLGEWFLSGDEPLDSCPAHVRVAVDARTGRPATRRTPRRFVELRTFVDLPPRYASWAAAAGLPRPPEPEGPPGALRFLRDAVVRLSIRSFQRAPAWVTITIVSPHARTRPAGPAVRFARRHGPLRAVIDIGEIVRVPVDDEGREIELQPA